MPAYNLTTLSPFLERDVELVTSEGRFASGVLTKYNGDWVKCGNERPPYLNDFQICDIHRVEVAKPRMLEKGVDELNTSFVFRLDQFGRKNDGAKVKVKYREHVGGPVRETEGSIKFRPYDRNFEGVSGTFIKVGTQEFECFLTPTEQSRRKGLEVIKLELVNSLGDPI